MRSHEQQETISTRNDVLFNQHSSARRGFEPAPLTDRAGMLHATTPGAVRSTVTFTPRGTRQHSPGRWYQHETGQAQDLDVLKGFDRNKISLWERTTSSPAIWGVKETNYDMRSLLYEVWRQFSTSEDIMLDCAGRELTKQPSRIRVKSAELHSSCRWPPPPFMQKWQFELLWFCSNRTYFSRSLGCQQLGNYLGCLKESGSFSRQQIPVRN